MKKLLVLLILVGSLVGLGHWLTGLASQPSIATVGTSTTTAVAPSMPVGVQAAPSAPVTAVSAHSAPRAATAPATTVVRPASTPTTVRPSTPSTTASRPVSTTVAPTTSTTVPGPAECSLSLSNTTPKAGDTVTASVASNRPNKNAIGSLDGPNGYDKTRYYQGGTDAHGNWSFSFPVKAGDDGNVWATIDLDFVNSQNNPAHCTAHYTVT